MTDIRLPWYSTCVGRLPVNECSALAQKVITSMAKTLGEIRKAVTYDTAVDIRQLARLFQSVAARNPQAVIDAFSPTLRKVTGDDPQKLANMVQFYADNAAYLADLFATD